MQWLRRLKASLERNRRVGVTDPAVRSPTEPIQEKERQPLSRSQQDSSWLPVYESPEPFSTPLPDCSPLWSEDTELRVRYLDFVAHVQRVGLHALTERDREAGRALAQSWRSRAIDLSYAKGTEQSPEIYGYMQCAVIASLFADGATSEAFLSYRKDVHHYKDSMRTADQVRALDLYVESVTQKIESGNRILVRAEQTRAPSEPVPQPSDMDELLSFLPRLYPNGIAIKTCTVPEDADWPHYFDVVTDFFNVVCKDCWCDIDYLKNGAQAMLENEPYIVQASLADIQTMLTFCNRGERFCDGYHGGVIEKGLVLNILSRLQVLRASAQ